jgi:hypothetical protein
MDSGNLDEFDKHIKGGGRCHMVGVGGGGGDGRGFHLLWGGNRVYADKAQTVDSSLFSHIN